MHWTKICCAVDFSPCSQSAVQEAATLAAARTDAMLTVVHVYSPPRPATLSADMLASPPVDVEAAIIRDLEGRMAKVRAEAEAIAGKQRVETLLLAGNPAEEIARLAQDGGYDLVVVGTHGRTGVRRLVLGSVAEHVVRTAPVSVLVVRGP
jgi:nucleotide-binding universal stress UspA family protein